MDIHPDQEYSLYAICQLKSSILLLIPKVEAPVIEVFSELGNGLMQ